MADTRHDALDDGIVAIGCDLYFYALHGIFFERGLEDERHVWRGLRLRKSWLKSTVCVSLESHEQLEQNVAGSFMIRSTISVDMV